jgi:hypothetical protein
LGYHHLHTLAPEHFNLSLPNQTRPKLLEPKTQ